MHFFHGVSRSLLGHIHNKEQQQHQENGNNGYRPFLYNISVDACDFMRNRKRYPVFAIYMNAIMPFSNVNHTCPYNHDMIVKDMVMREDMLALAPLPGGDYMFKLRLGVKNEWKSEIVSYLTTSDLWEFFKKTKSRKM
ncbi:uncharacterized protein LOC106082033 [Stomoxys calcitrans]|uniref:uncharacterized protein LOC106082033 n=1 Tax=Stomoxys calcitrans TaxID=35570 RepID=UPI0027E230C8|nr:uncharacterized protein LOC106082033 [Stomoxys calcitrans]